MPRYRFRVNTYEGAEELELDEGEDELLLDDELEFELELLLFDDEEDEEEFDDDWLLVDGVGVAVGCGVGAEDVVMV